MEERPQIAKLGGLVKSRFFVSVIGFLATIALFFWLIPKACRPMEVPPALFAAKPYILRAEKYLYSNSDPEIILMGSSLVLRPSYESDRQFEKLVVPQDEEEARSFKQRYTKAEHLRRLLLERVNGSFDVINIGIPACMSSDYYLILQKLKDFEKHPQVIVLAVAPRDFLDNKYPDPNATPSMQFMSACSPPRKWMRHPKAVPDFIEHFVPPFDWVEKLLDTATVRAGSYRYAFETSPDGAARRLIDQLRGALVQPPAAVTTCLTPSPPKKYIDLDVYNWCYNPANLEQLKTQFLYLDKFIALAAHGNIAIVLVDMPITPENQALIAKEALKTYKDELRQLANRHNNVMFVEASRLSGCSGPDFSDSVHLNASGGHKCFECIAKAIGQNSLLRAKLCALQSTPQL
ncbi:MAG: hypothetical protein C5B53_12000 [Candidatus Melainabacteria bacterium]|nr:MAG: hypothetical protein C5B53_12000 [Candidatus Melainabacteria bacterium]